LSKVAPVADLASKVGQTLASNTAARVDVSKWCKGVNPARAEDWFFDFLYIFPNFHIVFLGYQAYIGHKMMPGSRVDLSSWNAHYYAPPVTADDLEAAWAAEYMKYSLRDLWREDGNTTLGAQRSINSGVFTQMYLQDQEILIRHAEQVLAAEIDKNRDREES
jgi:hypothetical protein